ncbi:hypothetical protein AMTR_s00105p00071450 [Amborella trichopoda]|uniref:Uncharacterized protein n=1 Tax=Amborella trichopoda TaxID=13333 RepID=W1NSG0_AMBTC|nr:hypothetical protein AMTR_s00105p00071450 [Amborella trichopoda]
MLQAGHITWNLTACKPLLEEWGLVLIRSRAIPRAGLGNPERQNGMAFWKTLEGNWHLGDAASSPLVALLH